MIKKARDDKMVKILVGVTVNKELVFANINNEWDNFKLTYDLVKPVQVSIAMESGLKVYGDGIYTIKGLEYVLIPMDLNYNHIDNYRMILDSHGESFRNLLEYMETSRDLGVVFEVDTKMLQEQLDFIDLLPFNSHVVHTLNFYCV